MSECPATGVMGIHQWDDDVEPTHCVLCGIPYEEGEDERS